MTKPTDDSGKGIPASNSSAPQQKKPRQEKHMSDMTAFTTVNDHILGNLKSYLSSDEGKKTAELLSKEKGTKEYRQASLKLKRLMNDDLHEGADVVTRWAVKADRHWATRWAKVGVVSLVIVGGIASGTQSIASAFRWGARLLRGEPQSLLG
jgi:hypothetical protein